MLHLVTDGFFDILNLGWSMGQHICTTSPFITALVSVKDRSVNIFPIGIFASVSFWPLLIIEPVAGVSQHVLFTQELLVEQM